MLHIHTRPLTAERYEVIVYHKEDTSLSCLDCFNGDNTGDCMTLSNISNIPTKKCQHYQRYCKVSTYLIKVDNGHYTTDWNRHLTTEWKTLNAWQLTEIKHLTLDDWLKWTPDARRLIEIRHLILDNWLK